MKKISRTFSLALCIAWSSFSGITNADTVTTSDTLFLHLGRAPYLKQFNPSLGNLTGIKVRVEYNYEIRHVLHSFPLNPRLAHHIEYDTFFKAGLSIPTRGGTLDHIASIYVSGSESCSGPVYSAGDICTENLEGIDLFGSPNKTDNIYQRLVNNNLLQMFIGDGRISYDLLNLYTVFPDFDPDQHISDSFNINLETIYSHLEWVDLDATVTVIYTYIPRVECRTCVVPPL